jgi:hypothetical protein
MYFSAQKDHKAPRTEDKLQQLYANCDKIMYINEAPIFQNNLFLGHKVQGRTFYIKTVIFYRVKFDSGGFHFHKLA